MGLPPPYKMKLEKVKNTWVLTFRTFGNHCISINKSQEGWFFETIGRGLAITDSIDKLLLRTYLSHYPYLYRFKAWLEEELYTAWMTDNPEHLEILEILLNNTKKHIQRWETKL